MTQEIFKKLNIPEIPTDINNLRSYNDLFKLFKISQEIVDNMNKYIEQIVYSEYLKTKLEWKEILTTEDYDKIKDLKYKPSGAYCYVEENPLIFRCYKNNKFIPFIPRDRPSSTGAGGWSENYNYDVKTNTIIVTMKMSIYPYRREGIQPNITYQYYKINLLNKSVKEVKSI